MRQNSQPLVHKPNKMALFRLFLISLLPHSFICSQTFSPIAFSLSSSLLLCKLCLFSFYQSWAPLFFFPSFFPPSGSENCEEEPDPASRFWDELSHVGLPKDLNVQSLFESGKIRVCMHHLYALNTPKHKLHCTFVSITFCISWNFRAMLGTSELCLVVWGCLSGRGTISA